MCIYGLYVYVNSHREVGGVEMDVAIQASL